MNKYFFNVIISFMWMVASVLFFISDIKSQSYGFATWWTVVYTLNVINATIQFFLGVFHNMENTDE